ncbi:MAG TPA: hypothetical protein VGM90_04265 [Kofleriaceae bacterium]|jgi:hypothetical protein
MIVMTALALLCTLSVFSVRGGLQTAASDRFHAVALYAAESGAASAMDYLRANVNQTTGWTTVGLTGSNVNPPAPAAIYGNDKPVGDANNPFSTDTQAWYHVEILNDRADSGYTTGTDSNKRVIIRATGYGPDNASAIIEWDVQSSGTPVQTPCQNNQKNQAGDNSAVNECLTGGTLDTSQQATFSPS